MNTDSALEDLLAFGEPGLRLIAQLAATNPDLPTRVIDLSVAKWTHGNKEDWQPGYIDGPIQQLTAIASNYPSAHSALRMIAQDNWTYHEDAAYAAQGLAKAGFEAEAREFLCSISRETNAYCGDRVLAVELLNEIGADAEAKISADELASEWANKPPDMNLSWMQLAEILHKLGRTRAAVDILDPLGRRLTDELDLTTLAETYIAIGKTAKAKAAARRAFNTMEWSHGLDRGDDHHAATIAALLDRVGASQEAALVLENLRTLKDQARDTALDRRRSASDRLRNAVELFKQKDAVGITALEALLNDPEIAPHQRFQAAEHLLDSPARRTAVATLRRIALDEPWHRVSSGRALVRAGEPDEGCAILCRVAFESAENSRERTEAIEQLAQSGRIDLAIPAFRRFQQTGELDTHRLKLLENAFAHTHAWAEFLDYCHGPLSCRERSLQIEGLDILVRAGRIKPESKRAGDLYRHIISDRNLRPNLRMEAAAHLYDTNEDAIELVFNMTASPEETMEAGVAAMWFLSSRDGFMAMDGGHDVVWDKKLSSDQFIEAAHAYLGVMRHLSDTDCKALAGGITDAIREALRKIAVNRTEPIERRFAAAELKNPNNPGDRFGIPFWPGVVAICDDCTTPVDLRWPAIRYAVRKDPTLIERWRTVLGNGALGHLRAGHVYLVGGDKDAAAARLHLALAEEADPRIRTQIWTELAALGEGSFVGAEVVKAISNAVTSDHLDQFDAWPLRDLVPLARSAISTDRLIDLATALATNPNSNLDSIELAIRLLIECDAQTVAEGILGKLTLSLQKRLRTDDTAFRKLIYLCRLQAELGQRDNAVRTLNDIRSESQVAISERAYACRMLSKLGRTGDARAGLRRLLAKANTCAEKLAIAAAAIDIHDWSLARRTLVTAARTEPMTPREVINCADGLAKVGLRTTASRLLSSLDLTANERLLEDGVRALAACGQADYAVALARKYSSSADVTSLDRMEVLGALGDIVSKEAARDLIVRLILEDNCDVSACARGAELLHALGYKAEARSILFRLADQAIPDVNDALWVASSLLICDLPFTAEKILKPIDPEQLDDEDRERRADLHSDAILSQLKL